MSAALPRLALAAGLLAAGARACATDFDCSLNGVCDTSTGECACDSPWAGSQCEQLVYAVTPAACKNLWVGPSTNDTLNTWNGPILHDAATNTYHLYDPVYEHASLWSVLYTAHGVASNIEGPYDFTKYPSIESTASNPGYLIYTNASTGAPVYTFWLGNDILVSDSAAGPWTRAGANPMPSNTAPAYSKGAFFVTDQSTDSVITATSLAGPWTPFASIPHKGLQYTVEDPYMWVDPRGNFHVINHAYNTGQVRGFLATRARFAFPHSLTPPFLFSFSQRVNCSTSWVSSHFFAASDGKVWGHTDQPYGHYVSFDDGTWHSFCTLERPSLNFDAASGALTHIHFAADLVTQDEGCASRGKGCVDCKYDDHAGTLLVVLGAQ
jgi:hypothetical protein